jgi:hypothetical protein
VQQAPPSPPQQSSAPPRQASAPPPEPESESDSIPETALEFNPEATDVTKLFVEQTPNPEWSAATGKFKALSRKALAGSAPQTPPSAARPEPAARQDPPAPLAPAPAPAADEEPQYEVEIDAEFLSIASRLTPERGATHRPEPVDSTGAQGEDSRTAASSQTRVKPDAAHSDTAAETRTAAPSKRAPAATPPPSRSEPRHESRPESRAESRHESRPESRPEPHAEARPESRESRPAPQPVSRSRVSANTARAVRPGVGFADAEGVADTHFAPATEQAAPPASRFHYLWSAGTGALAILLFAQIVHHYRHDLAANDRLYRPLTALYSALGVSLVPRWNLGSYDVRQLGASAENAGQIMVRASVKNLAKQAQPLPLLRVTLQDRFGNRIAARDVPPESYLPRAIPSSSFLSSGQRIDAEMAFVDPGSNAVGFEIDACLPRPGGAIACANDASPHQ